MSTSGNPAVRAGAASSPASSTPGSAKPAKPVSSGGPATVVIKPTAPAKGAQPAKGGPTPGKPGPARLLPSKAAPSGQKARPTRRVRLAVTRIDPWSALKMSFLLSFAAAVGLVVMTAVLWMILSGMSVFADIDGLVRSLQPSTAEAFSIMDYIAFPRVMALAMVIGVIDVILLTALGTIAAYLYNLSAALVGGVQLTLTDD